MSDAALIALWEQWKQSFADAMDCENDQGGERARTRTRAIEQRILEEPAQGLDGIAIKFALWRVTNGHDYTAGGQAEVVYRDVTRLIDRDFEREARVILEAPRYRVCRAICNAQRGG
jgi:hypothetical protein